MRGSGETSGVLEEDKEADVDWEPSKMTKEAMSREFESPEGVPTLDQVQRSFGVSCEVYC
jgi:hypothetical protein